MKNLNLENLGVQELNAKEMVEIEGGIKFTGLITALYNAIVDAVDWVAELF